jgi:hypothetical protein
LKAFKLSATILFLFALKADAQPFNLSFTVGLNSMGVSHADGLEKTIYIDDSGFPKLGVLETKEAILLPPLRFDANYWLNTNLFVGTSLVFQSF